MFGAFDALIQRSIHLGLGLMLLFLVRPGLIKKKGRARPLLAGLGHGGLLRRWPPAYLVFNYDWVMDERFPLITKLSWYGR